MGPGLGPGLAEYLAHVLPHVEDGVTLGVVDRGRPQQERGQHAEAAQRASHHLEAECPASARQTPELEDGHNAEADTCPGTQYHLQMESIFLEILPCNM